MILHVYTSVVLAGLQGREEKASIHMTDINDLACVHMQLLCLQDYRHTSWREKASIRSCMCTHLLCLQDYRAEKRKQAYVHDRYK